MRHSLLLADRNCGPASSLVRVRKIRAQYSVPLRRYEYFVRGDTSQKNLQRASRRKGKSNEREVVREEKKGGWKVGLYCRHLCCCAS